MTHLSSRIAAVFIGLMLVFGFSSSYADERFNAQEIEQMVAPIALYPDPLLSQVLIAATYPLDVVQAARWRARQSRSLTEQQLSVLLENQPWDPSVKSVAAFPDVLAMMDDKIDWTSRLGDAFLDQQNEVMDAVQRLRLRAQRAGHLASGPQQRIVVSGSPPVIVIEPAQPEVIYVPVYNPLLVYGVWPYPNYRPYYWYPPRYVASGSIFGFSAGLTVGRALWSNYDWRHRNVYINVNRYNSFNRTRITSSEWHHNTRYKSEDYRRGYMGPDGRSDRNAAQRARTHGAGFGGQSPSARMRPDANPQERRPAVERRTQQAGASPRAEGPRAERPRAEGPRAERLRAERPRNEAARPNLERTERQAGPQAQRTERVERVDRAAHSRGRPDEDQRPQR